MTERHNDRRERQRPIPTVKWEQAIAAASLTKAQKAVLSGIMAYMCISTYTTTASIQRLAWARGYSKPTMHKAYWSLVDLGVITVLRRSKGGRDSRGHGIAHEYRLEYDPLGALARDYPNTSKGGDANRQMAQSNRQMKQLNGKATLHNQPQTIQSLDQSECRAFIENNLGLAAAEKIFGDKGWEEVARIIKDTLLEYEHGKEIRAPNRIRDYRAVLRYRLLGEHRGSHAGKTLGDAILPIQIQINKLREGRGVKPNGSAG